MIQQVDAESVGFDGNDLLPNFLGKPFQSVVGSQNKLVMKTKLKCLLYFPPQVEPIPQAIWFTRRDARTD